MITHLAFLFRRDLSRLREEVELYPDDASLWRVAPGITNSGGTLTLHLAGNLRWFIGQELGSVPYVRDRAAEFSRRDLPRADLLREVQATEEAVQAALAGLDEAALRRPPPSSFPGGPGSADTAFMLLSLSVHLNWHLGQINYHRRLLASPS